MQKQRFWTLSWRAVKKMSEAVDNSIEYNPKSVQLYNSIREYATAGYSKREIARILHCGRNTVTKYLNGNYESLCKRDYRSGMDQFYDDIIKELNAGVSRKDVYCHLLKKGYMGKHSAAFDYMNKIIKREHIDIAVYKSSSAEVIQKRKKLQQYDHISRAGILRFLWVNFDLSKAHCTYIMEHYPKIRQLYVSVNSGISTIKKIWCCFIYSLKSINYQKYRNYPALQRGLKKILKQSKIRLQARYLMDLLKGQIIS